METSCRFFTSFKSYITNVPCSTSFGCTGQGLDAGTHDSVLVTTARLFIPG